MSDPEAFKLTFPAAARGARPAAPALRVICFHNAGSAESYAPPLRHTPAAHPAAS